MQARAVHAYLLCARHRHNIAAQQDEMGGEGGRVTEQWDRHGAGNVGKTLEQEARELLQTLEKRGAELGVVHTTRRDVLDKLIERVLLRIRAAGNQGGT
jgi:phosphoglycolate phosphatase-like HAD superfamily hydrolase